MKLTLKKISKVMKALYSTHKECTICGIDTYALGVISIPEENYQGSFALCVSCLHSIEVKDILDELHIQKLEQQQ